MAAVLTDLERHASYSAHRLHRLVKLLVFRVCNTQSLFLVRFFADVPFYPCMAARVGNQALLMVLLDLTLSNLAEIGFSAAYAAFRRWQLRRAAAAAAAVGRGGVSAAGTQAESGRASAARSAADPARAAPLRTRPGGGSEAKPERRGGGGRGEGGYEDGDAEEGDGGRAEGHGNSKEEEGEEEEEKEEAAAEIELTDDYLELLYRQYVMLACLGAFPLVTVGPPPRLRALRAPCAPRAGGPGGEPASAHHALPQFTHAATTDKAERV